MAKENQCAKIIAYISEFGSITPVEALRDLSCMRLASRISDLKRMGYTIESTTECSFNRLGEPVRYKRYTIKEAVRNGIN